MAPVEQADLVDLKEWANHHVLAKRKDIYYPGVIAPTNLPSSVLVALRYPEGQQQIYQDIFSSGRFDVISDRVPSLSDVSFEFFNLKFKLIFDLIAFYWPTRLCSDCDS